MVTQRDIDVLNQMRRSDVDRVAHEYALKRLGGRYRTTPIWLGGISVAVLVAGAMSDSAYVQAVAINISVGIAAFLAVLLLLPIARAHGSALLAAGLAAAIALVVGAAFVGQPFVQSLMITAGVAAALIVVLEAVIRGLIDAMKDRMRQTQDLFEEAKRAFESAETEYDYKYAAAQMFGLPHPAMFGGIMVPDEDDDEEHP